MTLCWPTLMYSGVAGIMVHYMYMSQLHYQIHCICMYMYCSTAHGTCNWCVYYEGLIILFTTSTSLFHVHLVGSRVWHKIFWDKCKEWTQCWWGEPIMSVCWHLFVGLRWRVTLIMHIIHMRGKYLWLTASHTQGVPHVRLNAVIQKGASKSTVRCNRRFFLPWTHPVLLRTNLQALQDINGTYPCWPNLGKQQTKTCLVIRQQSSPELALPRIRNGQSIRERHFCHRLLCWLPWPRPRPGLVTKYSNAWMCL